MDERLVRHCRAVRAIELVEDVLQVLGDRCAGDEELRSKLVIDGTRRDQLDDFEFAWSETEGDRTRLGDDNDDA